MEKLVVSWFSAGVSSAVATKLIIDELDLILYTDIADQHSDTHRFLRECEEWFGKPIQILRSGKYSTVEQTLLSVQYVNGPAGAPCTRLLKRRVRSEWESSVADKDVTYVWGLDCDEQERADSLCESMGEFTHRFPLIERGITKETAHKILNASGISRPAMYDLGYPNNNCVGCVKGGMGYWNKIRKDFPDVFNARAKMERQIGASCINGVFLDELDPKRGHQVHPVVEDCGIMCELMDLNVTSTPRIPEPHEETKRRRAMAKQLNKQVKTLDAAVRLVLGSRKKASVIITQGGLVCSTGLDASAPAGIPMPKGVYQGEQLLAVSDALKYCPKVEVTYDQTEAGWRVVLFDPDDADARVHLDWQDCAEVEVVPPATIWKIDKDQLKMLKAAYTMAQALKKSQLRVVRLQPNIGVLSYLSPTTVAQWWEPEWAVESIEGVIDIEVADIKRAVLYRGAKLIAIGKSDGKINFAFDDGAFLRTDEYDGDTYDGDELQNVFTFDDTSYVWPLGAEQPAQALLELIAGGGKISETDGTTFYPEIDDKHNSVPMPLACGAGKFFPKVINQLSVWAGSIQPTGVDFDWKLRKIGFYSGNYRAVTSMAFEKKEAAERGME